MSSTPQYAILRINKIKHIRSIHAIKKHVSRTAKETPNADPEKEHLNKTFVEGDLIDNYNAMLPKKVRKNAVLMIDHLITASPEFFEDKTHDEITEWAERCIEWVKENYGAENVLGADLHMDESTPHLHLQTIPLLDGKLNARAYYGEVGALSKMQTSYHEHMKKDFPELQRGLKGSKSHHVTVKQFYASINDLEGLERPSKSLVGYAKRLESAYDAKKPIMKLNQALNRKLGHTEQTNHDLYTKNEALIAENETLDTQKTKLETITVPSLQKEMAKLKAENSSLRKELQESKGVEKELREDMHNMQCCLEENYRSLQEDYTQQKKEFLKQQDNLQFLKEHSSEILKDRNELRTKLKATDIPQLEEKIAELEQKKFELEIYLDQAQDDTKVVQEHLANVQGVLEHQLEFLEDENKQIKTDLAKATDAYTQLKETDLETIEQLKQELQKAKFSSSDYLKSAQTLGDKLLEARNENENLQKTIQAHEKHLDELETIRAGMMAYLWEQNKNKGREEWEGLENVTNTNQIYEFLLPKAQEMYKVLEQRQIDRQREKEQKEKEAQEPKKSGFRKADRSRGGMDR